MMLYLYPEEWTGRRAREVHTLSTCVALARAGRPVTLVVAGGEPALRAQLQDVAGATTVDGLELVVLSRRLGPIRSAGVFGFHFRRWLRGRPAVRGAFVIHLKAAQLLRDAKIPYAFEAHEVFAETAHGTEQAERAALASAAVRIATSSALAQALTRRYALPDDFHIVPNAGLPPLPKSVAQADGPFVYLGSIADWKGLELIVAAARATSAPLRVVGGTEAEWRKVASGCDARQVQWRPRVPVQDIPEALAGARAGVIATQPESGSGRYSCPMKLFDYASCGLPVLGTDLPSLQSLQPGAWFTPVREPSVESWATALREFRLDQSATPDALAWAAQHTWSARAEALARILPPDAQAQKIERR